jgi:hypothetical protein
MRRVWFAAIVLVLVAVVVLWRGGNQHATAPGAVPEQQRSPAPQLPGGSPMPAPTPIATPKRSMPLPALQLSKSVNVRETKAAAPGALFGSVIDAQTSEGIAGAELTFSHDDGAYSTTTDSSGAFRFAPHATGTYGLVSIEAKGFQPFEGEFGRSPVSFTSVAGKDVDGVVLRLVRERGAAHAAIAAADGGEPQPKEKQQGKGSLSGHVFDARSRQPIAAFAVAIFRRDGIATEAMAPSSFVDPAGNYQIANLAPGSYEATAMAAGYAWSSYAIVQIADNAAQTDFALHSGARVSGVVTDGTTHRAIAGATVSLEGRRGDAPDLPVAPLSPTAVTGGDGSFTLEHVPNSVVGLRVVQQGYLESLVSLGDLPEDGDARPLSIALTPQEAASDAHVEITGIGAVLQARGDAVYIMQVVPNGGASDAGLGAGDAILAVDGARVADLGYERTIGAIRGPVGTTVLLHIRRGTTEWDVAVLRKLVRS